MPSAGHSLSPGPLWALSKPASYCWSLSPVASGPHWGTGRFPSPHNHPKVPKEFFHQAWQHPLTTGPNQDLSHMCYIFIARNTDNCIFITITSCGKLSHSSLKLIKRTSFPNMEFFSSDQSTFLLNNQMKKYIYVRSRKQGCPFAHDPKRTLV